MTGNNIDLGSGTDTIKFTTATNADTVTVTNTTIGGAKTLIYEKTASNIGITTGAGADLVKFEDTQDLDGSIYTNSGNDSIQFLKNGDVARVDLGAGADSLYGAQILDESTFVGGAGQDTFLISTLSNSLVQGGADKDSVVITGSLMVPPSTSELARAFTLSVGATTAQSMVVLVTTPSS